MQPHDNRDLFGARKWDVVAETAAQKRIGQLSFGVACNDYDGLIARRHFMIDFPNDKGTILEDVQQVVLSIRIGLIDLIEQEHPSILGKKRPPYWPESKVIPDVVNVAADSPLPNRESLSLNTVS